MILIFDLDQFLGDLSQLCLPVMGKLFNEWPALHKLDLTSQPLRWDSSWGKRPNLYNWISSLLQACMSGYLASGHMATLKLQLWQIL